jgi:uncharacterized protein YaiI (UPF0178 family)
VTIWVDADACPRAIKEIIFRAAKRLEIPTKLVANGGMAVPDSPLFELILVPHGFNSADAHIAERVEEGDVVITADVPLAAQIVERGAVGIDPRGHLYTEDTVGEQLASRDLMQSLRSREVIRGGPAPITDVHRRKFASALDRILVRRTKDRS